MKSVIQHDVSKTFPFVDRFFHSVITSPPYYGHRAYDVPQQIWGAGEDYRNCDHEWSSYIRKGQTGGTKSKKVQIKGKDNFQIVPDNEQAFCRKCGSWRGHLGLEPDINLYVEHLLKVFREVRRVMRDDAVFFLNLGDTYAGSGGPGSQYDRKNDRYGGFNKFDNPNRNVKDLPNLSKIGIPWRVAFAMQDDGWLLRQEIVWAKGISHNDNWSGSVNPEPRRGWRWEKHKRKIDWKYQLCPGCDECLPNDGYVLKKSNWRPTTSHESVFMFAKGPGYYIDDLSSKEAGVTEATRNYRSVWTLNTASFKGAHFAVFPDKLVEALINISTGPSVCYECSSQLAPVIDNDEVITYKRTCDCVDGRLARPRILDPFSGTGTTVNVADELLRSGYGLELSSKYIDM